MKARVINLTRSNWLDVPADQLRTRAPLVIKRLEIKKLSDIPIYTTPKILAEKLGISYWTLLKHIRMNLLDAQPFLKGYRIPLHAVGPYLDKMRGIEE